VTISASPSQIREGITSTITFSTNFGLHPDIQVNYVISGRAVFNVDYGLTTGTPGVMTIPANQTSATLTLFTIPDTVRERRPETAIITLAPGSGYVLPTNRSPRAVVRISDPKN
jgi:hypothetical protein